MGNATPGGPGAKPGQQPPNDERAGKHDGEAAPQEGAEVSLGELKEAQVEEGVDGQLKRHGSEARACGIDAGKDRLATGLRQRLQALYQTEGHQYDVPVTSFA